MYRQLSFEFPELSVSGILVFGAANKVFVMLHFDRRAYLELVSKHAINDTNSGTINELINRNLVSMADYSDALDGLNPNKIKAPLKNIHSAAGIGTTETVVSPVSTIFPELPSTMNGEFGAVD